MFTLNCKGRLLVVDKPLVMGIINTTPDSFYSGSRQESADAVLYKAEKMLTAGATILDIGGQSTRPGSEKLGADEELKRVIVFPNPKHGSTITSVIPALRNSFTFFIKKSSTSVVTFS